MSFAPLDILAAHFSAAIAGAFPDAALASCAPIDPAITASKNPQFGDFQSNVAMSLAKVVGKPPRDVARAIVAQLAAATALSGPEAIAEPITEASIAGPGFINITLRPAALGSLLARLAGPDLGLPAPAAAEQQTVVVDLCGVNLAKEMHIGHLRSTVIGDTNARIFERLGCRVFRQNHFGDWGLPIAMVCDRLMRLQAAGELDLNTITLVTLDKAYKAAQRECERDAAGLAAAQAWGMGPKIIAELEEQVEGATEAFTRAKGVLLKLQAKDPAVYAVWQKLSDVTLAACLAIAKRLNANVTSEHTMGESAYADQLAPMVADLVSRGIAVEDDGALVVKIDDTEPNLPPCLIRKRDGGFLYATTDMAGVRHRVQKLGADRVVYTVDARQADHFRQVFAAARKAGFTTRHSPPPGKPDGTLEHAAFGMVLGNDGKPFKTRSGENVRLSDVLDDAQAIALTAVNTRETDLTAAEKAHVAWAVSVAAIRYADLSNERMKDYSFNPERMLAFEGNTGPYLLYALVRMRSIFRKAAERGIAVPGGADVSGGADVPSAFLIRDPAEKTLALTLLRFPSAVRGAAEVCMPSRLCAYAYELAGAFSTFFDACPVLSAPDEATRTARLALCHLTERVLADTLGTLGIPTVERM
ncbi:MAG: arginine--tRNA ligase [Phycisphaerales bacterium]